MAYEIPGYGFTLVTGADLSTHQYKFVDVNSSGLAVLASAGADAHGVVQNKPASGRAATVVNRGISKVVAGAAVAAGAQVTGDSSGRAVTATTGNKIHGTALQAAGGAGEIIPVLLEIGNAVV
jgi:hypothetical protein